MAHFIRTIPSPKYALREPGAFSTGASPIFTGLSFQGRRCAFKSQIIDSNKTKPFCND